MTTICIYQTNRGLGACGGPVGRITVLGKTTLKAKALLDLTERLEATDEVPGVCTAHQLRAAVNGYLLAQERPAITPTPRRRGHATPPPPPR